MSRAKQLDLLLDKLERLCEALERESEPRRTVDHGVSVNREAEAAEFAKRAAEWGRYLQGKGPRPK